MAFEDVGSGRTLEVYYKALVASKLLMPVIVYTKKSSYINSPEWITNKLLYEVPEVKKSKSMKEVNLRYSKWFSECFRAIDLVQNLFYSKTIWITDNVWPELEKKIGKNIVQVFHGELFDVGFSYFSPPKNESFKKYSLIFAYGRLIKNRITKRCGLEENDRRIKTIGRVLNDSLYNGSIQKNNVLKEYRLNQKQKTIIYAPSWESKRLWPIGTKQEDNLKMDELCKYCYKNNFNLILRPHPITLKHYVPEKFFEEKSRKYKNVYFDNSQKINSRFPNKSLVVSDILITDLSSIALDIMSLGKPAIFIYPDRSKMWGSTLPSILDVKKVSYVAQNFVDLYNYLKILKNKESKEKIDLRKKYVNYAFSQIDGKSGHRFRKELEKFTKDNYNKLLFSGLVHKIFKINKAHNSSMVMRLSNEAFRLF